MIISSGGNIVESKHPLRSRHGAITRFICLPNTSCNVHIKKKKKEGPIDTNGENSAEKCMDLFSFPKLPTSDYKYQL